jgi:hypothetical protein
MCRQVLFEGAIDVESETNSGNPNELHVDYGFTNKMALTGTDKWTDPASKPMEQLQSWRREIVAESGVSPNILLMRSETAMTLINNASFKEYFDTLRYNFGTIEPELREPLLSFYGRLPMIGADIYSYDATFIDPDSGDVEPFIPDNHVLFASTVTKGRMFYGAVTYTVNGVYHTVALPRVPQVFFDDDSSTRVLRLSSRPLPMPVNVEGWAVRVVA